MDRRKFLGIMGLAGVAAAIPAGVGLAAEAAVDPLGESTVTTRPDGSTSIEGHIQYSKVLKGYVVQALVPSGSWGQYLIANPNEEALSALAKTGDPVLVQGMLGGDSLQFTIQTIDGKAPGQGSGKSQKPSRR
jgi:hypothetical protein